MITKASCFRWLLVIEVGLAVSSYYAQLLSSSGRGEFGGCWMNLLLCWLKFGVTVCQDDNGHQQRLQRLVIKQRLVRPRRTKPCSVFHRRRVDTSPQEVAAPSKGEVNFGFNPLQSALHTPNQTDPPGCFYQRGPLCPAEPLHSLITAQVSHNANQQPTNPPNRNHKGPVEQSLQ